MRIEKVILGFDKIFLFSSEEKRYFLGRLFNTLLFSIFL